jgi:3-oxoadipate enol-lactonase
MPSVAQNDTFTTSDGTSITFTHRPARNPGAPRIALVHSLALDRSVWDGVTRRLEGEAEVLTYDCRGHGRSDRRLPRVASRGAGAPAFAKGFGEAGYSAQLFARDLAELFDRAGWQSAAVAGCSMGGNVAQAFAAEYPGRTTALGLIDTTAWYGADAPAKFKERAEAAKVKGMKGLIDFQLTRWFSDEFRGSHPDVLKRTTDIFVANDVDCYAASCELLGAVDMRPHLGSFRMPVAIVVGEEDYATPVAMARQLHEAIPQSTLTILPRARHLTPIEHPEQIASDLRGLLSRR